MAGETTADSIRSGNPRPVKIECSVRKAAIRSKTRCRSRQSRKSGGVTNSVTLPILGLDSQITARRSESAYGRGRNNTPLTMLNIALFAPIARVRASAATSVGPGAFNNIRQPYRRSLANDCILELYTAWNTSYFSRAKTRRTAPFIKRCGPVDPVGFRLNTPITDYVPQTAPPAFTLVLIFIRFLLFPADASTKAFALPKRLHLSHRVAVISKPLYVFKMQALDPNRTASVARSL